MEVENLSELRLPKINEALELALEAIDKESNNHLIQIEESFPQPPTVPSNNQLNITTCVQNTSSSIKTQENRIMIEEQQQIQTQTITTTTTTTLNNKTDEEKCRKLQNQEQSKLTIEQQQQQQQQQQLSEKTEEEISKEPIYENVITTSTTTTKGMLYQQQQQQTIESMTNNISKNTTTLQTTSAYQEQQPQIIPSMISRQRQQQEQQEICDELLQHNQNLIITNDKNFKQNQNFTTNQLQQNQQQQRSQINSCLKTTSTQAATATCSINNNNNNKNNNNNNLNLKNNGNLVELTTAFANQTITDKITAAANVTATALTADNIDDDNITSVISIKTTNNSNKNNSNSNNNNKMLSRNNISMKNNHNMFSDSATVIIEQNPVKIQSHTNNTTTIMGNNISDSLTNDSPISSAPDSIEPYYQVPKSSEPYYDAPKHLKPVPVYENIEIFFNGSMNGELNSESSMQLQPPKEKPPPPPVDSPPLFDDDDVDSPMDTNYSSSDNTYETLSRHQQHYQQQQQQQQQQIQQQHHLPLHSLSTDHPSPPMKRMNSTKRIKKEIRNKRSSFLGIEGSSLEDDDSYLELTVAPPPDMAQLLQEERRLEKQLYLKAGLCDSSDTGESRDSGVSENHSRQSSEHYTNSSEENEPHDDTTSPLMLQTQTALDNPTSDMIYQNDGLLAVAPTPLLQTVKGNSAESWTESATVAAAATQSLTEATATANAKMMSIEEKIREQEEVLRVERELLQLEQEELKRQRENLMLRETMARRELQHGAKMLMSANRRSLQDLNGLGAITIMAGGGNVDIDNTMINGNNVDLYHLNQMNGYNATHYQAKTQLPQQQQQQQQIYANIPNLQQQYYQMDTDYRKSMSDINEFSKHIMQPPPPVPPSKPMRSMHTSTTNRLINGTDTDPSEFNSSRQRHSLNSQHFGGSLVKIAAAAPTAAPRGGPPHIYSNYHHQSAQNLNASASNLAVNNGQAATANNQSLYPGNMSRNTLHALSATPKPKYTDGWVQVQQRKSYDTNFANDPAWVSAYQQKRKSMPDATYQQFNGNNHWLVQEAEQRRLAEQQQRRGLLSSSNGSAMQQSNKIVNGNASSVSNGKPLPDSIIQSLTERVQSKGIGERKRNNLDKSPLHAASQYHQQYSKSQQQHQIPNSNQNHLQTTHIQLQQQTPNTNRHQQIVNSSNSMTTSSSSSSSTSNGQLINTTTTTTSSSTSQQDKVLSVSGKKKCSHCGDELGRGAAMIIESLLLFYHINCFKCCVCHVQLGDGLNGTDVRVRNHKLHCQNCYSSDDGIKFSCV